jgi:putative transposase
MAKRAKEEHGISVELACATFSISESCYRYVSKLVDENKEISDWLIKLSNTDRNWGFGMCFLHLRNVFIVSLSSIYASSPRSA